MPAYVSYVGRSEPSEALQTLAASPAAIDLDVPAPSRWDDVMPTLQIDLDVPPQTRWDAAVIATNTSLWKLLQSEPPYAPIDLKTGEWDQSWLGFDYTLPDEIPVEIFSEEQWEEMRGIASISRLPLRALIAMNLIYELTDARQLAAAFAVSPSPQGRNPGCTSVLVADQDGVVCVPCGGNPPQRIL